MHNNSEAVLKGKEFLELRDGVLGDPESKISGPRYSGYVERRVAHSKIPDVTLGVVHEWDEDNGVTTCHFAQLGVIEQDGSAMHVKVNQADLEYHGLREDPFTSLIMSYFRSHLSAK
jgi:hypothetical protein